MARFHSRRRLRGQRLEPDPTTVRVVIDANIWLDIAEALGPERTSISSSLSGVSESTKPALKVHQLLKEGKFTERQPLKAVVSHHIVSVVEQKLSQPNDALLPDNERGLGWTGPQARRFIRDIIFALLDDATQAGLVVRRPAEHPTLDGEDRLVLAAYLVSKANYLITRDAELAAAVPGNKGMSPTRFLATVKRARQQESATVVSPSSTPPPESPPPGHNKTTRSSQTLPKRGPKPGGVR